MLVLWLLPILFLGVALVSARGLCQGPPAGARPSSQPVRVSVDFQFTFGLAGHTFIIIIISATTPLAVEAQLELRAREWLPQQGLTVELPLGASADSRKQSGAHE